MGSCSVCGGGVVAAVGSGSAVLVGLVVPVVGSAVCGSVACFVGRRRVRPGGSGVVRGVGFASGVPAWFGGVSGSGFPGVLRPAVGFGSAAVGCVVWSRSGSVQAGGAGVAVPVGWRCWLAGVAGLSAGGFGPPFFARFRNCGKLFKCCKAKKTELKL